MTPTEPHSADQSGSEPTQFELAQVSRALHELPTEVPVPEHISDRIAAALAAETAARVPAARPTTGTPWFRRALPRMLVAAATIGVIGIGGYLVTGSEGGSDSADQSATSGGAEDSGDVLERDEQDGSAESAQAPAEVPSSADLEQKVIDVWRTADSVALGCGQSLADDLDAALVGSTTTDDAVLIVVESGDGTELSGYLVPTCTSSPGDALTAPVVVASPTE